MTVTAVAEPSVGQPVRNDLMQMDLTQAAVQLEALIDSIIRAGYLDDLAGTCPKIERAQLILDVCQAQAGRVIELSRSCEEARAGTNNDR